MKEGLFLVVAIVALQSGLAFAGSPPPPPCPVVYGGWSGWYWSAWSATCGVSISRSGYRYCNNPTPQCGGATCSGVASTTGYTTINCPINGGWSGWSIGAWTPTCGNQVRTDYRYCNNPTPAYGGAGCSGSSTQTSTQTTCCPQAGGWSGWSIGAWSATCGTMTRTDTRSCNSPAPSCGGASCSGGASTSTSQTLCCPAAGGWSGWTWGSWSATCGSVTRSGSRSCTNPAPYCGGAGCSGVASTTGSQNTCCPVLGGWSAWAWSGWSTSCGSGTRSGTRSCTNPAPYCTSSTCSGASSTSGSRNTCCPVNGGWTAWSWGSWSATCGSATRPGTRTCTNPADSCGGATCSGASSTSGSRSTCCPVNGGWTGWVMGAWSATCGSQTRTDTRACTNPSASCGGAACAGSTSNVVTQSTCCPVNGGWSAWSIGTWSATCGSVFRTDTRACTNPAASCNGAQCPGLSTQTPTLTTCCPVAGGWAGWTAWSAWAPATCNVGQTRAHTRTCTSPTPSCNGATCPGASTASTSKSVLQNCCSGYFANATLAGCQRCTTCVTGLSQMSACLTAGNDTVCADITVPVVDLNPPNPQFQQAGTPWIDPGATAYDSYDGVISLIIRTPVTPNVLLLQPQPINYTARDKAGNTGFAVRIVNVSDTLPPTLTLIGQSIMTIEAASVFVNPGCLASDLVDGNLTNSIVVTGAVNTTVTGTYTLTYSCCDRRPVPNCASITRTVIVVQTILPVITVLGNATMFVEATFPFVDPGTTVVDTLDRNLAAQVAYYFQTGAAWTPVGGVDTRVTGTYNLTYSVINSHGLAAIRVFRIVIVRDTIPPNLTLFGATAPYQQQGSFVYLEPGYSAIDLLDGNDYSRVIVSGNNFNTFAIAGTNFTISYFVNDTHGNAAPVKYRYVTIIDTIAPNLTLNGPSYIVWEAARPYVDAGARANDLLYGNITNSIITTGLPIDTRVTRNYTITYNVCDSASNCATATRTVNVVQTIPPVLRLVGNATFYVEATFPFTDPFVLYNDTLDSNLSPTVSYAFQNGSIWVAVPSVNVRVTGTYNLTYRVTNSHYLSAIPVYRTVIVRDTIPPNLTLFGSTAPYLQEGSYPYVEPGYSAIDLLDGNDTSRVIVTGNGFNYMAAAGTNFTISYFVNDTHGNAAPVQNRFVTIVDTILPILTMNGPNYIQWEAAVPYVDPGCTAFDSLDGNLTLNINVTGLPIDVFITRNNTITYTVCDRVRNCVSVRRVVNIVQTVRPYLRILGNATFYVEATFPFIDPGVAYNDTLDAPATLVPVIAYTFLSGSVWVSSPNVNNRVTGSYNITYTLTDSHGLAAIPVYRTVIVRDTIPPNLTLFGATAPYLQEGATPYIEPGYSAIDLLDGNDTSRVIVTGNNFDVAAPAFSNFTIAYSVTDTHGNTAPVKYRYVMIIDTIPPVLTLLGNQTYYQQGNETFVDPGCLASDTLDGNITASIQVGGQVDVNGGYRSTYTLTYTVRDRAGNAATPVTRTVIIVNYIPPTLTLIEGNLTLQGSFNFTDPGATAWDVCDGDITNAIRRVDPIDNYAPAGTQFTLTYSVTDSAGLTTVRIRVVTIIDDIPPVITLLGNETMTWEGALPWVDPGYTAFDLLDGNITPEVNITGTVDVMAAAGSVFVLSYNVIDRAGNRAATRTRTVTIVDTTPPVITLLGNLSYYLEGATPWVDPGWVAWDTLDLNETSRVQVGGDVVDSSSPAGTVFVITYNLCDNAGNCAVERIRHVIIVDRIPPVITLNGPAFIQHEGSFPYLDPGATAWDSLDLNITANITVAGLPIDVNAGPGTNFTITYTVTDRAGNRATPVIRTVMIIDTLPPVVTLVGKSLVLAQGGLPYIDLSATAYDQLDRNMDSLIVASVVYIPNPTGVHTALAPTLLPSGGLSIISTYAPLNSIYNITYSVRDRAGNTGYAFRTVQIVDTLAPELTVLGPSLIQVRVGTVFTDPGATSYDRYSGNLTSTITRSFSPSAFLANITSELGSYMLTYTSTDAAGNTVAQVGRMVRVVSAPPAASFEDSSTISMTFTMAASTPTMAAVPVAYSGSFLVAAGASAALALENAGIAAANLQCTTTASGEQLCSFQSEMLTAAQLNTLGLQTGVLSFTQTAVPVLQYTGAFTTFPAVTPSAADARILLEQRGAQVINVSCADSICTFVSSTMPSATAPVNRRSLTPGVEIASISTVASPAPSLRRVLTIDIVNASYELSTAEFNAAVDNAIRSSNLFVTSKFLDGAGGFTYVRVPSPIPAAQMSAFRSALLPAMDVTDDQWFIELEVTVPLNVTEVLDGEVRKLLYGANIPFHSLSCSNETKQCSLLVYQDVAPEQFFTLQSDHSVLGTYSNPQPLIGAPDMPAAPYMGSIVLDDDLSPAAVLQSASGNSSIVISDIACKPSLLADNSLYCTYFSSAVFAVLSADTIANSSGIHALERPHPYDMATFFAQGLIESISSMPAVSPDRITVTSINLTTGSVTLSINDDGVTPWTTNGTMVGGSFVVANIRSISIENATNLLLSCGITPAYVTVIDGTQVFYRSNAVSWSANAVLAAHPNVVRGSATGPVAVGAVLAHSQIAELIAWNVDNYFFSVSVRGRSYWALPGSTLSRNIPKNSASTSESSSSSMLPMIAGAAAGGAILVVLAVIVVRRRRQAIKDGSPREQSVLAFSNPFYSAHDDLNRRSSFNRGSMNRGTYSDYGDKEQRNVPVNPIYSDLDEDYDNDALHWQGDMGYHDINPLYDELPNSVWAVPVEREGGSEYLDVGNNAQGDYALFAGASPPDDGYLQINGKATRGPAPESNFGFGPATSEYLDVTAQPEPGYLSTSELPHFGESAYSYATDNGAAAAAAEPDYAYATPASEASYAAATAGESQYATINFAETAEGDGTAYVYQVPLEAPEMAPE
eukprot:m.87012 g.87012  ORF g.87012 m.87012 type:complete len:2898 (+) comp8300_c0_seq3:269-8962(+)